MLFWDKLYTLYFSLSLNTCHIRPCARWKEQNHEQDRHTHDPQRIYDLRDVEGADKKMDNYGSEEGTVFCKNPIQIGSGQSGAIWARVGNLRCLQGQTGNINGLTCPGGSWMNWTEHTLSKVATAFSLSKWSPVVMWCQCLFPTFRRSQKAWDVLLNVQDWYKNIKTLRGTTTKKCHYTRC